MSMLIWSEKSSLAITAISVTSADRWIHPAMTLHVPAEQIYLPQNKHTTAPMGCGRISSFPAMFCVGLF